MKTKGIIEHPYIGQTCAIVVPGEDATTTGDICELSPFMAVVRHSYRGPRMSVVPVSELFETLDAAEDFLSACHDQRQKVYCKEMRDIQSCLRFAYHHDISGGPGSDWDAKLAYSRRVQELTGEFLQ